MTGHRRILDVEDAGRAIRSLLDSNARDAPKLPRLSYRHRRALWLAENKTGADAALAMQQELERKR